MGQTVAQIVGNWHQPGTFAHLGQIDRLIRTYVEYCTQPRATTYYVDFTGGSDSNDGLSPGAPFKNISKVNTVCAASSGNVAFLFKRGQTWNGTTTLTDAGKTLVLFGAYGTGAKPKFTGNAEPTAHGVQIDGDGSCAQNLDVSGWGNEGATAYCIAQTNGGTDVTLVIDCDLNDGANHNQGHIVSTGSGGIAVCVRVKGGVCEGPTATPYVSYARDGGNWLILDDCYVTGGTDGGEHVYGVYMHTDGVAGHYVAGMISRNLRVTAGNVEAITFTNVDPAEPVDSGNFVELGTEHLGYVAGSSAGLGLPIGWKINCRYQIKPTANGGFGTNPLGTTINCVFQVDNSSYAGFNSGCFFNSATASPRVYHSLIHWLNHGAGGTAVRAGIEYETAANAATNRTPNAKFYNNIYVAENCTQQIRLGLANTAVVNGNAFKGISASGNYPGTNDIELADLPLPLVSPIEGVHSTAGAAVALPDDLKIEYDFRYMPRSRNPNVGPVEFRDDLIKRWGKKARVRHVLRAGR